MTNLHPSEIGRLERLPVWAQDALARLDRELSDMTRQRDELVRTIGEPSGVGRDITAIRVPRRRYIHATDSWTDGLRVRFDGGQLEIAGNGPLLIKTTASNTVLLSEMGR